MSGETCQRCGSVGEDRRTLWMACFYAMNELGVPFAQKQVHGVLCEKVGERRLEFMNTSVPVYEEPKGEPHGYRFYTLRVCKRCRAEWMSAVKDWFNRTPDGEDHDADSPRESSVGTGIFVRVNGAVREVTREEWDRLYANRTGEGSS